MAQGFNSKKAPSAPSTKKMHPSNRNSSKTSKGARVAAPKKSAAILEKNRKTKISSSVNGNIEKLMAEKAGSGGAGAKLRIVKAEGKKEEQKK
ncbi:hypothetical protein BT69DRAFT_1284275 [Atractiella rhizophila]|nr:hypothetical protein BT69DRAFT_1291021 [Atractiella rhizophila]KAH8920103.1 hypothetical protein BT69DRAFT_1284275 [Atractiella rhizophila]